MERQVEESSVTGLIAKDRKLESWKLFFYIQILSDLF